MKGGNENGVQPPPPPPYTTRPGMTYTNGFPFAGSPMASPSDPQQQHILQLQIRQQQLQLQQMQQQSLQQQQKQHSQQQQQQHISSTPLSSQPTARFATPLKSQAYAMTSPQKNTPPTPMLKKPVTEPPSAEQIRAWVAQCDWRDKTIHVARQLLGGSTINGFLKATAAAQRIKRQRARQFALAKNNVKRSADQETPGGTFGNASSPEVPPTEEELKNGTMNARTAKKIKTEMEQGVDFVKTLYETIQGIMKELDPTGRNLPPPIDRPARVVNPPLVNPNSIKPTNPIISVAVAPPDLTMACSPGDAQGSTLRKHRRRKLDMPPLEVQFEEHDTTSSGKRTVTKREHVFRIAELLRFRALRNGDYVAARVSSRDLWILARVVRDYPSIHMNPNEFLNLTLAKRDALFREKVAVKDAEEKESGETILVSRQLVLPLPRSYGEAAEWGTRYVVMDTEWQRKRFHVFLNLSVCRLKKGMRVYAMYPNTTSLYMATVVDSITYCRGDDDIIVVEFDEDEKGTIVC